VYDEFERETNEGCLGWCGKRIVVPVCHVFSFVGAYPRVKACVTSGIHGNEYVFGSSMFWRLLGAPWSKEYHVFDQAITGLSSKIGYACAQINGNYSHFKPFFNHFSSFSGQRLISVGGCLENSGALKFEFAGQCATLLENRYTVATRSLLHEVFHYTMHDDSALFAILSSSRVPGLSKNTRFFWPGQ
jgi:hypothetical protein